MRIALNCCLNFLVSLLCLSSFCGLAPVLLADDAALRTEQGTALFTEHVRNVLIHQCLECHGGGSSIKGKFDLSTREKLLESGFIDTTADASYLVELIEHRAEPHMPFKAPKLKAEDLAHIRQWIDLGAPYDKPLLESGTRKGAMVVTEKDREFWSFRPLADAQPPQVAHGEWAQTPIDQFILAKLQEQGLTPNAVADRRTLIRRAYFDLLGLPPTATEVQAFVDDPDPHAFSKLIDTLLNSEHYGERWARHWLDLARFGESHGYEQDYDRPHAYHYRDFLIKAFNADMPFDQFVRWQLAGDELAPEDPLALSATGFLGAGAFPTQLTEDEFESARYDELDDMVATTGVAFLGLSIGCARCHDHKFDPIPVKDYYQLVSTFRTAIRSEIDLDLDPAGNAQAKSQYAQQLEQLRQQREQVSSQLAGTFSTALDSDLRPVEQGPWELLGDVHVQGEQGTQFAAQPDGSWLATGEVPDKNVYVISGMATRPQLIALRLEALAHDSLPAKGPGRASNGNFVLGNISLEIRHAAGSPTPVKLTAARATHQQNQDTLSVAASLDADPVSGWAVDQGGIGKDQAAVFDFAEPITLKPGEQLAVTLTFQHPNSRHALGRLRLSVTDRPQPAPEVGQQGPAADVLAALQTLQTLPAAERPQHPAWTTAFPWYRETQAAWVEVDGATKDLEKAGPAVKLTKVMVTSEGFPHMSHHADGRGFPHFYPVSYFLTRGDAKQKGDVAEAGYLQVLMRNGKQSSDWSVTPPPGWERTSFRRTALANWMTDTDSGAGHLLARVIVNRLWQHHFGRGIVATPNDFGFPGERPTHPELLDWLAHDLIKNGWQLKRLHKLMLLSSTYQQNGDWDEARASIDRENHLFWRRAPQRLEGEAIRDAMLYVSGRLDPTMYGPGTLDQNTTRRSVYFFIKRSNLIPMMMLFDWPEHLVSIGQRSSTTVAPQALMFMNSPQGRSYAEALASHVVAQTGNNATIDQHIAKTYELVFSRPVQPREQALAHAFLEQQAQVYRNQNQGNATQLALTDLCQTLLSANEFCYLE